MTFDVSRQADLWGAALCMEPFADMEPEEVLVGVLREVCVRQGRAARGLDIGCGNGRHLVAGTKLGYEMVGVDFSQEAIRRSRRTLAGGGCSASLVAAPMDALPFGDGTYDLSIAWCVLNHGTPNVFRKGLSESLRVVKKGGLAVGFIMSRKDSRYGTGLQMGEHEFMFTDGVESGIYHYFSSDDDILSILESFGEVLEFREVCFGADDMAAFHPSASHSCHYLYAARRR